jgi:hypothetical protein
MANGGEAGPTPTGVVYQLVGRGSLTVAGSARGVRVYMRSLQGRDMTLARFCAETRRGMDCPEE